MTTTTNDLIQALIDPALYPHPSTEVRLMETHISWILLTGLRAYKIKKPVDFGFVDFTTLERRRRFCEEELRLNRRLAPDLYLDVVAITGTPEKPILEGSGSPIEYAVCMMQFDQQHLLSHLPPDSLRPRHIADLADQVAQFHRAVERAPADSRWGSVEEIRSAFEANFDSLCQAEGGLEPQLSELRRVAERQFEELEPVFCKRKASGMVRECHGDMHLGNMFLQDDHVTVFDGIEFSEDLRWIDVMSDVAFVYMDLVDRGCHRFSSQFLNRWLEQTGDYEGLAVLRFYSAYRAMVRAKVDTIRMHQNSLSFSDQRHLATDCCGYLDIAGRFARRLQPRLTITSGPSGSGKTTAAQRLIDMGHAIRVRSDVERKRLFGLASLETSNDMLKQQMYSHESDTRTYGRLAELAETIIRAGYPVVVDAAFLRRADRDRFRQLASLLDVPFSIIRCSAGEQRLQERIADRRRRSDDASEADEHVLALQLGEGDALDPDELRFAVDGMAADLETHFFEDQVSAES